MHLPRRVLLALVLPLAIAAAAPAVIIDSGDGTGNTTAPVPDPGWRNVGNCHGLTGVYLGGKFDEWQRWQSRRNFERPFVLALVSIQAPNRWLYAGVHASKGSKWVSRHDLGQALFGPTSGLQVLSTA